MLLYNGFNIRGEGGEIARGRLSKEKVDLRTKCLVGIHPAVRLRARSAPYKTDEGVRTSRRPHPEFQVPLK